jgi:membrane glycosyltransferase
LASPVAVVMPIYNEDVTRVFEGLRAMVLSIDRTGCLANFDFFVLSDSDNPNKWIEEEAAWMELCRQLDAYGKIFYRKRRLSLNKKSGNIADFCRRWGAKYRYLLVLDADSLMTGERMVEMTRLMDAHPELGILQTAPKIVAADTLFGRLIQFSQALYGDPFMRGLSWLQMGDANFWGHNAILRLKPFMEHCALPELPGNSRILSHDFVEAALMRKAGFWVWLLPAEDGSWEETPPSFLDFLKRERRWCQGNLQHFWLLFAKGFKLQSRLHFLHGILGYVASPLWLIFLITATGITLLPHGHLDWHTRESGQWLLAATLGLLFVPKLAILLGGIFSRRARSHGGRLRLFASGMLDTLLFTVLAPVAMVFRSRFVYATMAGQGVKWVAQRRKSGGGEDWREAILTFGGVTLLSLAWAALAWWLSPVFFLWLSPVLAGLALAIPFAIFTSGSRLNGLFMTPDEVDPPALLVNLNERLERARAQTALHPDLARHAGLMEALLDPYVNALHVSLLRQRASVPPKSKQYLESTRIKLMRQGPDALTPREIKALMYDPDVMLRLHFELWSTGEKNLAAWWTQAMRQYNVLAKEPPTGLAV